MSTIHPGQRLNVDARVDSKGAIAVTFALCFLSASLIYFLRNPQAVFFPVLFAEDGSSYIGHIYSDGFWQTLPHARPDYLVFGNMILAGIAVLINQLLYGENILHISQIIAVLSYLFYGFIATLPVLIFWQKIDAIYLILLVAISAFLPLNGSEFEVFGRAANIGFAGVYLAFLLICWRNFSIGKSWRFFALDVGFYLCLSTNPITYLSLPLIYLPYIKALGKARSSWRKALLTPGFLSAVGLGVLAAIQCVYWVLRTKSLHHDLQTGAVKYFVSRLLEILLGRSILYPAIFPVYRYLNDVFIIALFICFVVFLVRYAKKQNYELYFYVCYCLATAAIVTLISRPSLLRLARHYTSTFPDRYYYGQNLLAAFLIVLLFSDAATQISVKLTRRILLSYSAILVIVGTTAIVVYWDYNPLQTCKPFAQALQDAWKTQTIRTHPPKFAQNSEPALIVETCPAGWNMPLPRSIVRAAVSTPSMSAPSISAPSIFTPSRSKPFTTLPSRQPQSP
jgi:hypothetical protein